MAVPPSDIKGKGIPEAGLEKIFSTPMFYPVLLGEERTLLRTVEQVTYAVSYMMLTAKDLGVDSCIIGAISNAATVKNEEKMKKVNDKLNLNDNQVDSRYLCLFIIIFRLVNNLLDLCQKRRKH